MPQERLLIIENLFSVIKPLKKALIKSFIAFTIGKIITNRSIFPSYEFRSDNKRFVWRGRRVS